MFFSFQPLNWPQKLSPSFSLILCEVTRTEWWPGQKSMITLEVLADRRVGGQKSKPRSRGTDNWGQSPCKHLVTGRRQGWERAGVGWALGCPAGEVLVWGQLLAQPSCTFSPSLLMRMSPRLSSAWGSRSCCKLKAIGGEELVGRENADSAKAELWYYFGKDGA